MPPTTITAALTSEPHAKRSKWDLIGSILLLLVAMRLIFVLGALICGIAVIGAYGQSVGGDASWIVWAVAGGIPLLATVGAAVTAVVRLAKRRPAWWIVLAADLLSLLTLASFAVGTNELEVLWYWLFFMGAPFA